MKRYFLASIVFGSMALLLTPDTWAQAELVKQKAVQIRDNNNQQQGVASAPASMPGAPSVYAASGPAGGALPMPPPNSEQFKLINRLSTDFGSVKPGVTATPEQKSALAADILALSKVGTKPTKDALAKLSSDLAAALSEKTFSAHDLQLLGLQINAVMNSSTIKGTVAQSYVQNTEKLLKTGGVTAPAVQAVTADLTGIVTTLQKDKPKLYQ